MSTPLDWKHWALTHALYLVAIVIGGIGIHSYIAEHDARVVAEAKVKADESQVATLQQAITANNQAIAQLQEQQNVRDAAAALQLRQLSALVSKVQTPTQVVGALPSVTTLPATPSSNAAGDITFPAVDAVPLFRELSQGKQDSINLTACTADLKDEKSVAAKQADTITAQTQQLGLKDNEIDALKHPKGFWKRFGHDLKVVAFSVAAGALLVHGI